MTNKPKKIGTAAESAVLKVCLPYFPDAHRLVLAGQQDQGDIRLSSRFILEVKGGKQAQQIGDVQLAKWMTEANVEAAHANVDWGILVTQRAGVGAPNAHRWWAWLTVGQLICFGSSFGHMLGPIASAPVRMELGALLEVLAESGVTDTFPDAA